MKHKIEQIIDYDFLIKNNTSTYIFNPIFDTIDSTNTYIENNSKLLKNKSVILTRHQTNGRGRYERNFVSNINKGIYCSFLIKENIDQSFLKLLHLKIACALHNAIKITFNIDTQIKWPNDLILQNKKCAGILIETQYNQNKLDSIIIGFGLNIYKQVFNQSLNLLAVSLEDVYEQDYNQNQLLINFFETIDEFLYKIDAIEYFRNHMIPTGTLVTITLDKSKKTVKIINLNSDGQLIVETENKNIVTLFNEEIIL